MRKSKHSTFDAAWILLPMLPAGGRHGIEYIKHGSKSATEHLRSPSMPVTCDLSITGHPLFLPIFFPANTHVAKSST